MQGACKVHLRGGHQRLAPPAPPAVQCAAVRAAAGSTMMARNGTSPTAKLAQQCLVRALRAAPSRGRPCRQSGIRQATVRALRAAGDWASAAAPYHWRAGVQTHERQTDTSTTHVGPPSLLVKNDRCCCTPPPTTRAHHPGARAAAREQHTTACRARQRLVSQPHTPGLRMSRDGCHAMFMSATTMQHCIARI